METGDGRGVHLASGQAWKDNDEARRRQLREDARRSLAENLAEGLALSEFLSTFTGAAHPR